MKEKQENEEKKCNNSGVEESRSRGGGGGVGAEEYNCLVTCHCNKTYFLEYRKQGQALRAGEVRFKVPIIEYYRYKNVV